MKRIYIFFFFVASFFNTQKAFCQIEPFIGQIALVPYNFAPRGWALCNGQILSIQQYPALFTLLGSTYGGNGTTTFALPDLRGRVPVSSGQAPGLSNYYLGEQGGTETFTLSIAQLPPHSHSVNAVSTDGDTSLPTGALPANTKTLDREYSTAAKNTTMNASMIGNTGAGQPVPNRQPYVVLNYIIALEGIYPSRN